MLKGYNTRLSNLSPGTFVLPIRPSAPNQVNHAFNTLLLLSKTAYGHAGGLNRFCFGCFMLSLLRFTLNPIPS
jgi:hypothetical protein